MEESPRRSNLWLIPVVLLVVVCAVVGGMAARQFYTATQPSKSDPAPTSSSTGASAQPPGSQQVTLSADASRHPLRGEVQATLQGYFYAINNSSFVQWRTFVSAKLSAQTTQATWAASFTSVKDSDIVVARINGTRTGGVTVLLSFTSRQDLDKAPPVAPSTCDQWWVTWPMVREQDSLKIDTNIAQTPPIKAC